jgi:hypothetical protein
MSSELGRHVNKSQEVLRVRSLWPGVFRHLTRPFGRRVPFRLPLLASPTTSTTRQLSFFVSSRLSPSLPRIPPPAHARASEIGRAPDARSRWPRAAAPSSRSSSSATAGERFGSLSLPTFSAGHRFLGCSLTFPPCFPAI